MTLPRSLALVCAVLALALPTTAQAAPLKSWYVAFPTNFKVNASVTSGSASYTMNASAPWLEWVSYDGKPTGVSLTNEGPVTGSWSANLPEVCSQSGTLSAASDFGGISWGGTDGWYATFHVNNKVGTPDSSYSCLGPTGIMNSAPIGNCQGDAFTYPHSAMLRSTFVIDETCTPPAPDTGSVHHHVEFAIRKVTELTEPIEGGAPITKFVTPRTKKVTTRPRTITAQIRATRAGNVRVDMRFGQFTLAQQTFKVTAATTSIQIKLPPARFLNLYFGQRTTLPITLYEHGGSVGLRQAVTLMK